MNVVKQLGRQNNVKYQISMQYGNFLNFMQNGNFMPNFMPNFIMMENFTEMEIFTETLNFAHPFKLG